MPCCRSSVDACDPAGTRPLTTEDAMALLALDVHCDASALPRATILDSLQTSTGSPSTGQTRYTISPQNPGRVVELKARRCCWWFLRRLESSSMNSRSIHGADSSTCRPFGFCLASFNTAVRSPDGSCSSAFCSWYDHHTPRRLPIMRAPRTATLAPTTNKTCTVPSTLDKNVNHSNLHTISLSPCCPFRRQRHPRRLSLFRGQHVLPDHQRHGRDDDAEKKPFGIALVSNNVRA